MALWSHIAILAIVLSVWSHIPIVAIVSDTSEVYLKMTSVVIASMSCAQGGLLKGS